MRRKLTCQLRKKGRQALCQNIHQKLGTTELVIFGHVMAGVISTPASPSSFIAINNSSVAENSAIGTLIGTLSVAGGSGTYSFTMTDDAGGLFALDNVDDTLLEVAGSLDYESVDSHVVTIEADNGVNPPISRDITITVTDIAGEWDQNWWWM